MLQVLASHWLSPAGEHQAVTHTHTHTHADKLTHSPTHSLRHAGGKMRAHTLSKLTRVAGLALPVVGALAVEVVEEVHTASSVLTSVPHTVVHV